MQNLIKFKSEVKGNKCAILICIHGNEPCGYFALREIMKNFKILSGELYIILGNPKAFLLNKRFYETDLNRCFIDSKDNSYESNRSIQISKILDKVDSVLDIHSSFVKESPIFSICEKETINLSDNFNTEYNIVNLKEFHKGSTDYYMHKQKKEGLCIECGYHESKDAKNIALNAIKTFLQIKKISNFGLKLNQNKPKQLIANSCYLTKNNFSLIKEFSDFEKVKKNQTIGFDGNIKIESKIDAYIVFAKNCNNKNQEAFVLLTE